jgi:hypothetical protein
MKGPNPNTKINLKEGNIYPGVNPSTKTPNECSSLSFVSVFPQLISFLTSQNLEQFIKDHHGDKIPFITTTHDIQRNLADRITIETYESIRAQKLTTFRDEFRTRWNDQIYHIHQSLQVRYPRDTLALITNKDLNKSAKDFNALRDNANLPIRTIHFGDQDVDDYILEKFHQSYAHFADLIPPFYLTNEIRRTRLQLIGQTQQLDKDIEAAKLREQTKETSQSENIRLMKHFFNITITNYPPEITTLVENREFAKAWNKILVYNLQTIDSDNIHISLQRSILNLEFDINVDKTFLGYYERHLITHALLLFKKWHIHLTFDDCKYIVDTMTDAEFATTYAQPIDERGFGPLTLPDICSETHRLQILKAAFKGTHLQETLSTFEQLNSNTHTQTVAELKTALQNKDTCTDIRYGRKGAKSVSHSDNCITCKYLKEDLHFDNAVNHPGHEPCPSLNLDVWKVYFSKNPVKRSDRTNPNRSNANSSSTSNPRGTNSSNSASAPSALPVNFDETTKCAHCYRSGLGQGRDSASRKQDHTKHPSEACPYLKAKQNDRLKIPRHGSPGMQPPVHQSYRQAGYSNNNSNDGFNHQGNLSHYNQNHGKDNNQYSQSRFHGNNAYDQQQDTYDNNRERNQERGRNRDRDNDNPTSNRDRDRDRDRDQSQSSQYTNNTRQHSRSRSRGRDDETD